MRSTEALRWCPTRLTDCLEQWARSAPDRHLIQRQRNAADGRPQHLLLTDRGRKLARDAAAAAEPMERASCSAPSAQPNTRC